MDPKFCFVAGTLVMTKQGLKAIEKIKVGDQVLSYNDNLEIFEYLKTQTPGAGGEIQLTDSIRRLMKEEKVYAYNFEGVRYDAGDKFGYVSAVIDFALERDDLREKVLEHLKKKLNCK